MHPASIILICLFFSAFFSGMETAFISANRLRIELDKKQGFWAAHLVSYFTRKPADYIATMLLGNNITLVIYGLTIAKILEPRIYYIIPNNLYVIVIQTIISTLLILITAEFLPKAVFRLTPNFFLNALIVPVTLFYIVLFPVTKIVMAISHLLLRVISKGKKDKKSDIYVFGKLDLNILVQDINQGGTNRLDTAHEIRIFKNALDFSHVKVRECMVPRPEIAAVENTVSIEELRQKFIETGYSKLPVYEDNIDNIIGYLSSKDLFKNPQHIKTRIIKAPIVPETMNANKLLRTLLQEHKSLAIVVDEFGGTSGIITTEDIMEEIFGEIEDEHDTNEIVEKKLSDNSYILSGKLEIEYLNEKYNLKIPEAEEYETLAGYIFLNLGRIPTINEQFDIEQFNFKILKINNKRLELIYLKEKQN